MAVAVSFPSLLPSRRLSRLTLLSLATSYVASGYFAYQYGMEDGKQVGRAEANAIRRPTAAPRSDPTPEIVKLVCRNHHRFLAPDKDEANWWRDFEKNRALSRNGNDATWRPVFVGLQAALEASLLELHRNGKIKIDYHLTHTDLPSSALCDLANMEMLPEIRKDDARLSTVKNRSEILGQYLEHNVPIYVAYSQDGLSRRDPASVEKYKNLLARFSNLHDRQLNRAILPEENGAAISFSFADQPSEKYYVFVTAQQVTREGKYWRITLEERSKNRHPDDEVHTQKRLALIREILP